MSTPLGPPTGTYAPPTDLSADAIITRTLSCPTCRGGMLAPRGAAHWTCPGCGVSWIGAAYPDPDKLERLTPEVNPALEAMTLPDLLARDEALRDQIQGAERAGDLGRARALFVERLGVGREISARRAVALATAAVPAGEGDPVRPIGSVAP